VRAALQSYAEKLAPKHTVRVEVNTADGDKAGELYLTLTGTSAEMGDDGSVGRGNRVTGLITPFRSGSLEAAAGKNPISHVGKIYNVLSYLAAKEIVAQVKGVREASVYMLSQIGHPLDQPLICTATLTGSDGALSEAQRKEAQKVLDSRLARVHEVRKLMAGQKVKLY